MLLMIESEVYPIVGVVGDYHFQSMKEQIIPNVYHTRTGAF